MAKRAYTTGQVGNISPIDVSRETNTAQAVNALYSAVNSVIRLLNLGLSLGDGTTGSNAGNLDAAYVEILTPDVPNEEFEIVHYLGRLPIAYDLCRKDRACDVFDSSSGSWNDTTMRLKCNTASATILLRIY